MANLNRCIFDDDDAVGLFYLPKGCVVFGAQIQLLCFNHSLRTRDNGAIDGMELLTDLTGGEFEQTHW